eukprot:scaffold106292_cov48-Phaeocystis_antarctica.AAC.1
MLSRERSRDTSGTAPEPTEPTETVQTEVIGMAAVDNPAFLRWLHRKCLRAELVGIALLVAYFLIMDAQFEDEDGTVEFVVIAIVIVLGVSRAASGLASSRLPTQLHHWD